MNLKYQYPGEVIDADLPVNANVVAAVTTTTAADNERLAKLFAAAPDLLESCRIALNAIPMTTGDGELGPLIRAARRRITLAIKRATTVRNS